MKKTVFWSALYEDENIIAVNKASGIAVTGDRWIQAKERLDKLIARELGIPLLYVAHRIDSGCSGALVFAKTAAAHKSISLAFEQRRVTKEYTAIVRGRPSWREESCDLPLLASANKRHKTIVENYKGKKSLTHFSLLFSAGKLSVIHARPVTGRQHQIRVHLAALGHPIVSDELYGDGKPVYLSHIKRGWRGDAFSERPLLARLGLHAARLAIADAGLDIEAPLHKDMAALICQLKKTHGAANDHND
ncbi:MAG: RNA pseudouridine synthase [Spirochaetaceae bacterium]|jgi:RluA family pseudouridine synthase|nr:RNA pseudouridine synthase [Spirochaetaceae bacterium]